jgi:hypothetical protein
MANMVERVAAAISDGTILPVHRQVARLAIEAMREPTSFMIARALDTGKVGLDAVWSAMIDAALEEVLVEEAHDLRFRVRAQLCYDSIAAWESGDADRGRRLGKASLVVDQLGEVNDFRSGYEAALILADRMLEIPR